MSRPRIISARAFSCSDNGEVPHANMVRGPGLGESIHASSRTPRSEEAGRSLLAQGLPGPVEHASAGPYPPCARPEPGRNHPSSPLLVVLPYTHSLKGTPRSPETPVRPGRLLLLATLITSFLPSLALAQASTSDADTREVLAYRLTMSKLKQLNVAMDDLHRQRDTDPSYQQLQQKKKELAALGEKDEPTAADQDRMARLEAEIEELEQADEGPEDQDQSLSAMAERMASDPRVAAALKKAGLAPREAATMSLALFQAAFTVGMLDTGTITSIPKDINTDNVKFYQANRVEIEALTALRAQGGE